MLYCIVLRCPVLHVVAARMGSYRGGPPRISLTLVD